VHFRGWKRQFLLHSAEEVNRSSGEDAFVRSERHVPELSTGESPLLRKLASADRVEGGSSRTSVGQRAHHVPITGLPVVAAHPRPLQGGVLEASESVAPMSVRRPAVRRAPGHLRSGIIFVVNSTSTVLLHVLGPTEHLQTAAGLC